MSVRIVKAKGRYNMLRPQEEQWQLCIAGLPEGAPDHGSISVTFDEDDEPSSDESTPPSEAIEEIADRVESYWISTSRERSREVIEWVRANAELVDADWAAGRLESLKYKRQRLDHEIERMEELAALAERENG